MVAKHQCLSLRRQPVGRGRNVNTTDAAVNRDLRA